MKMGWSPSWCADLPLGFKLTDRKNYDHVLILLEGKAAFSGGRFKSAGATKHLFP